MTRKKLLALQVAIVGWMLAVPHVSEAIPAFARKYGTSCLTCHSIYPRLTPFGEAFRRNGYRFPGVDSDYVKQDTVALGQEANKKTFPKTVWPATLPISVPLAVGANGKITAFPDKNASTPRANDGAQLVLDDLVTEGHLWAGAALDDTTTLWAEITLAADGVDIEHAQVLLNDLLGPKHAFNVVVGRGFATLTSFGPHSSYLGDLRLTTMPVTGLYGVSGDPFVLTDNYNGVEVTGVVAGFVDYSVGLNAGKNSFTSRFGSENVYGHLGYKLGGLRLDGEGAQGPKDAMRPWAETAVTLDAFAFHSREHFPTPGAEDTATGDTASTVGGAARGQLGSLELDVGAYWEKHDHATATLASVRADVQYAELSYVLYPWMVPAIRVERIGLSPSGGPDVNALHVMPGVAFLLRPNVKAVLVANIERAGGFPVDGTGAAIPWTGGNADWGGFVAAPKASSTPTSKLTELESVALFLAWAL
jgi:hypothetical protein